MSMAGTEPMGKGYVGLSARSGRVPKAAEEDLWAESSPLPSREVLRAAAGPRDLLFHSG